MRLKQDRQPCHLQDSGARPAFTLVAQDARQLARFERAGLYEAALAYIRGEIDVQGDLLAAIRFKKAAARRSWRDWAATLLSKLGPGWLETWWQSRRRAVRNVRFHYDRSNEFYAAFLDTRMVYSCAYFEDPERSLEEAQSHKLDHICRKLDLRPGERFLDIGCGWGALAIRAAAGYGAYATGCTLSSRQAAFATRAVAEQKLQDRVTIRECDYRELEGRFAKIASVGMFEHVGRRRLREYFRTVFHLLEDDGLFLNHGIVRPEQARDGPETVFLRRKVFPGGQLAPLSTVIAEAGRAGFEVLDVENLRPHYALTCRRWVERLQANAAECLRHVDRETYRTWLLYLAGSAVSFESGATDVCQILMAKRSRRGHPRLTRNYMYLTGSGSR